MSTESINPIYKSTATTPENRNTPRFQDNKSDKKTENPNEPFENFLKREIEIRKQ